MRKIRVLWICVVVLFLSSCIPFFGGNYSARDNLFDSDGGIHSLELQQGTTVKQLYDAIKKTVNEHPKEFELRGNSYRSNKARVWTFSEKYGQPVTFYALKVDNQVYLGIGVGENAQADDVTMKDIYYLEDLVLNNLNQT